MSKHCEDCGNNPSPHWLLYVAQTTVYLISTLPRFMFKKPNRQFKKVVDWIAEKTHIVYWSDDIEPDSERTKVVVAAAKKTGVRIQQQKVFGKRDDMLRFEQNGTWHEFFSLPSSIQDGEKTRTLLDSKWHTKQF
ncbi:hypothetical protein KC959_03220, partial [Candidatus Saccharibacteria bacterium]|nr:hypothetical protein [Candidatus Saccharibacteria bacterium]